MNKKRYYTLTLLLLLLVNQAYASISLDRTRVIYPGEVKSMSLNIRNNSTTLPYLAQAWLEDADGKKINSPFTILPPIQRLEPGMESLVKIQSLSGFSLLPQDKETLFYFNLREIPPRSDKPNSLQLALQTRIKFFYRPASLLTEASHNQSPWQNKVTLQKIDDKYQLTNPTPYYVTIVAGSNGSKANQVDDFQPVMISPHSRTTVNVDAARLGKTPSFTYVDDFGGHRTLNYQCNNNGCSLIIGKNSN